MNQDVLPKQSYRGVLCMSCRQPIPLPAIVISLSGLPHRAFTLRCRACCRERPYRIADVVEFEGTPRSRISYIRGPLGIGQQQRNLSRAANS